jgi:hypothetical protein
MQVTIRVSMGGLLNWLPNFQELHDHTYTTGFELIDQFLPNVSSDKCIVERMMRLPVKLDADATFRTALRESRSVAAKTITLNG